ncbi:putative quorum-sensing-regulated virulence factor [Halomonas halodenitrificans]|nr:DUF3820 family protein [Halomonas halodenitrificans]
MNLNSAALEALAHQRMPFGKYQGTSITGLPGLCLT